MQTLVIAGRVKKGRQRGRKNSFPTINIDVPSFIKKNHWGIYISIIQIDDNFYPAVTHLGPAKTFAIQQVSCESYLLNLQKKLYRKKVAVILVAKIRPVKKFANSQILKTQIIKDVKQAKKFFNL
ncbi:MAG: riboflavin kinase [Candidatus Buchananbacteria bacterium]|nr:riboflavin kinase [Candidatus Buchananbacteria bacterium]